MGVHANEGLGVGGDFLEPIKEDLLRVEILGPTAVHVANECPFLRGEDKAVGIINEEDDEESGIVLCQQEVEGQGETDDAQEPDVEEGSKQGAGNEALLETRLCSMIFCVLYWSS